MSTFESSSDSFRWDWYQATIPTDVLEPEIALQEVVWALRPLGARQEAMPSNGYARACSVGNALIMWGGHPGFHGVHVVIRGGVECSYAVDMFRSGFPDHKPSRVDVALDWQDEGVFDLLTNAALSVARKHGLATSLQGDWVDSERGRTLYVGSTQSTHRLRVYEKGYEQRAKGVDPDAPLDWVRTEFQVRPDRRAKAIVSRMSPCEVAASTAWTADYSERLGQTLGRSASLASRYVKTETEKTVDYVLSTFAKTLHKSVLEGLYTEDELLDEFRFSIKNGFHPGVKKRKGNL